MSGTFVNIHILKNLSQTERSKEVVEMTKLAIENNEFKNLKTFLLISKDIDVHIDVNAPEFAEKDPNDRFYGWTLIQKAAYYNEPSKLEVLMQFTANTNAPTPCGWTPIQIAVNKVHLEIVKILAPHTNTPNAANPLRNNPALRLRFNGWTPLQVAVENAGYSEDIFDDRTERCTEIVKILAPLADNPNAQNPQGWTPLQKAVSYVPYGPYGITEIVKIFAPLASADNLNVSKDPDGYTILERATLLKKHMLKYL